MIVNQKTVAGGCSPGEKQHHRRGQCPVQDGRYLAPNSGNEIIY